MSHVLTCTETNLLHPNSRGRRMWSKNPTGSDVNLLEEKLSKYLETKMKKKSKHGVRI